MRYKDLVSIFRTLAGRRRLEIIHLLKDGRERSVSNIAADIKLSIRSTSKHLLQLLNHDFVEARRVRNIVLYKLADKPPQFLQGVIKEIRHCR